MSETNEFSFTGVSTNQANKDSVNQVECFIDLQDQKSKCLLESLLDLDEQSNRMNLRIIPMVSPENRQSFYLLKSAIIAGLYQSNKQSNHQSNDKSAESKTQEDQDEKSNTSKSASTNQISTSQVSIERLQKSLNQSINEAQVIAFLRYFYPQSDRFNSSTHYVNKTEEDLINHCCRLLTDFASADEEEFDSFYALVKSYENHLSQSPTNDQSNKQSNSDNDQPNHPSHLIEKMALSACRYAMKRGIYQSPTLIVNGKAINNSIDQHIKQVNKQSDPQANQSSDALKAAIQQHLEA